MFDVRSFYAFNFIEDFAFIMNNKYTSTGIAEKWF